MRQRFVLILALLTTFALLAAACGDDGEGSAVADDLDTSTTSDAGQDADPDDEVDPDPDGAGDDDDADATTTTSRVAEPHPGVTDDSITIGVLSLDWQALADVGVDTGRNTTTDLYVAALEGINDRGGVHGRMLDIRVEEILPLGAQPADEACVSLTEDQEVFLTFGVMLQDTVLCYTELNESAVINFLGRTAEREERARAPYVTLLAKQSELASDFVAKLEAQGVLEGATIGVLGSVDADEQAYLDVFDAVVDAGYQPVPGLIGGNQDDLAASTDDQALILERFESEGVDVTIVTTGVPLVVSNAFDVGYDGGQWAFVALPDLDALADAGVDLDYLEGAVGVTTSPVGTSGQPTLDEDPVARQCLEELDEATGRTHDLSLDVVPNDVGSYMYACFGAEVLERALDAAGPELDYISLQAGFESIGDIDLAGYGPANLSAGNLGAIATFTPVELDVERGIWTLIE